jgi:hypothetical protein
VRVEAGRQTDCRIGRNQSRPGDGRGHAQVDAEASPIARECPHDIGHHHYQDGALRGLLIHAIEKPQQRDYEKATADPKQSPEQTGHPAEARCGGDTNCRCDHPDGWCRGIQKDRECRIEILPAKNCGADGWAMTTEEAVVGSHFHIKPLLPVLEDAGPFRVLTISARHTRSSPDSLLEGNGFEPSVPGR